MQADDQLAIFNAAPFNRIDVKCPAVVVDAGIDGDRLDLEEGDIIEVRHLFVVVGGGRRAKMKPAGEDSSLMVEVTGERVVTVECQALPGRGEITQVVSTASERNERYGIQVAG